MKQCNTADVNGVKRRQLMKWRIIAADESRRSSRLLRLRIGVRSRWPQNRSDTKTADPKMCQSISSYRLHAPTRDKGHDPVGLSCKAWMLSDPGFSQSQQCPALLVRESGGCSSGDVLGREGRCLRIQHKYFSLCGACWSGFRR